MYSYVCVRTPVNMHGSECMSVLADVSWISQHVGMYMVYTSLHIPPVIREEQQLDRPKRGVPQSHEHVTENETMCI